MPLTDSQIRAIKSADKPTKISDGGGLYLLVQPTGSKLWRQAFRFDGKQHTLAHGRYPEVSLGEARRLRDAAKAALRRGIDPRKADDGDSLSAESLEAITREYVKIRGKRWTAKHQALILRRFELFIFDDLGRKPIGTISAPAILETLRKIEAKGSLEVAKKARQTLSAIFRYAIATGRAEHDPAHALKDAMQPSPPTKHRLALPMEDVGRFLYSLRDLDPTILAAVKLAMHTALRSNEVRYAQWGDIRGDLLTIPAERMKARADHVLPLSRQVKTILAALPRDDESDLILYSPRTGRPLDQMTMVSAIYRHGWKGEATIHGFRSLFSTQATESGLWSEDAIELSLAHRLPGSGSRRAYNRAKLLDERTRLMQWWSDRLDDAVQGYQRERATDLSGMLT